MKPYSGPPTRRRIKDTASPIIVKSHTDSKVLRFEYIWTDQCEVEWADSYGKKRRKYGWRENRSWREKTSPVFSPESCSHLSWSLRLDELDRDDFATGQSIFLCYEPSEKSEVEAKFRFHYEGVSTPDKDSPAMTEYCLFKHGTEQASYGYYEFCEPDSDGFEIRCEIEVRLTDDLCAGKPCKVPDDSLLNDMVSAFGMEKHTDFIITNGEVSIPVHKVILSIRSTVFAAMFEHDTKEQRENRVDVPDITTEALTEMLRYIYTDNVMGIEAVARDLLAAAEKYCLDRLKAMCEEALRGILDVDNAAELLVLADLYRADQLKARAIEFINTRILVMDTPGFKSMSKSHPWLLAEIMPASATKRR